MVQEVPDIDDVPHVSDVDHTTLVTLSYVRDDDTLYRVLPNHEGHGRFDLIEVEEENQVGSGSGDDSAGDAAGDGAED